MAGACSLHLVPRDNQSAEASLKITLVSDDSIRLDNTDSALTVEAATTEQSYSPFHMLGSALAVCTWSVLHSWASRADLGTDDLTIEVKWTFAERPHRVGDIGLTFSWPSLPDTRRDAARRAAALCAIHATLSHPPAITISDGSAIPASA